MPVVIPFTFVGGPGNKAKASQVNANFLAFAAKFSTGASGIGDDDFTADAARRLSGLKLSQNPGFRVPTLAIEEEAVTDAKLAFDASLDAGRAVGTDHIKDGAVTSAKIAAGTIAADRLALSSIPTGRMKLTIATGAYSASVAVGGNTTVTVGTFAKANYDLFGLYIKNPSPTPGKLYLDDTGANYVFKVLNDGAATVTVAGTVVAVLMAKA